MVKLLISLDNLKETKEKSWVFWISKKFYSFPTSQCKMEIDEDLYLCEIEAPQWLMDKPNMKALLNNCNVEVLTINAEESK